MLIKINDKIINTAHIISAHFISAGDNRQANLTLIFVNHREAKNATGIMPLQGDEAMQVWNALSQEAHDVGLDTIFSSEEAR